MLRCEEREIVWKCRNVECRKGSIPHSTFLHFHTSSGSTMRVLIVEDEQGVARFLQQAVEEAGYSAEMVGDGQSALSRATVEIFDLILLDVLLPRLDGLSVSRQLRQNRITTPILMITAK